MSGHQTGIASRPRKARPRLNPCSDYKSLQGCDSCRFLHRQRPRGKANPPGCSPSASAERALETSPHFDSANERPSQAASRASDLCCLEADLAVSEFLPKGRRTTSVGVRDTLLPLSRAEQKKPEN